MTFYQEYKVNESDYGERTITVIVSDVYANCFLSYANVVGEKSRVSCLYSDNVKKDLGDKSNNFATDQLTFSINQAAFGSADATDADRANNQNCLFFCMQANDINVNRYIAIHFGSPSTDNCLISGVIQSKISGEDVVHSGGKFATNLFPIRKYKFTVKSIENFILEKAMMRGDSIRDSEGLRINNIRERLQVNSWYVMKQICVTQLSYRDLEANTYLCVGNLFSILQAILNAVTDLSTELVNETIHYTLLDSNLGISTNPTTYRLCREYLQDNEILREGDIYSQKADTSKVVKLRIKKPDTISVLDYSDSDWSSVYVGAALVDEELCSTTQKQGMTSWTFTGQTNVLSLLQEIALSFGCYIRITRADATHINIKFIPRTEILGERIYVHGMKDASIELSSQLNNTDNHFFALGNSHVGEVSDYFRLEKDAGDFTFYFRNQNKIIDSAEVEKALQENESLNVNKGIKSKRLMFSVTSSCILMTLLLQDARWKFSYTSPVNIELSVRELAPEYRAQEFIHSSIYIATESNQTEEPQIYANLATSWGSAVPLIRPAWNVYANIKGDELSFKTLSEYINYISGRDVQYFENAYEITVPFWSGFSTTPDNQNCSFNNLQIGKIINITDKVKVYSNNTFTVENIERSYLITAIEIDLKLPSSKITLQNIDKVAFLDYSGTPVPAIDNQIERIQECTVPADKKIAAGEIIQKNDAVRQLPNGEIVKATTKSTQSGRLIGVAAIGGTAGDIIPVLTQGEVFCDFEFGNTDLDFVFVRNAFASNASNLSGSPLEQKSSTEDVHIRIGRKTSSNSFVLDILEIFFE